jgi:capsular polysaccharide export protein
VVERSLGVVTVNSTVGTLALNAGKPVVVLGHAVYKVPGVVHKRSLDEFWSAPGAPDAALYSAFRRVLIDRCLIRGGLLSEEGLEMLVENAVERLTRKPPARSPSKEPRLVHDRDRARTAFR